MNNPIIVDQNNLQGGDKFEIFNYNNLGSIRVQEGLTSIQVLSDGITLTYTVDLLRRWCVFNT